MTKAERIERLRARVEAERRNRATWLANGDAAYRTANGDAEADRYLRVNEARIKRAETLLRKAVAA